MNFVIGMDNAHSPVCTLHRFCFVLCAYILSRHISVSLSMHTEQESAVAIVKRILLHLKQAGEEGDQSALISRLTTQFDREFKKFQSIAAQLEAKQNQVLAAVEKVVDPDEHSSLTVPNQYNDLSFDDMQFLEYNAEEIDRRHREIKHVESEVLEVAELYRDLQLIVNEQQTAIDSTFIYISWCILSSACAVFLYLILVLVLYVLYLLSHR